MTNTDGVYVDGRQTDSGDCSGPKSARNVLMHPDVDAAVFEVARGGVLREGLGFDRCQVAVVTNIGSGDHLGLNYITTVEDLAVLKRVIVQNVAPDGYAVLNAADPNVAAMAASCPGQVIFFAADRHASGDGHAPRAGQAHASTSTSDTLVAAEGSWRERIPLRDVPITRNGTHRLPGRERHGRGGGGLGAWASTGTPSAAAWPASTNDAAGVPGRFNVMDYRGATVIADYGHNTDAMRALVAAVDTMPAQASARW